MRHLFKYVSGLAFAFLVILSVLTYGARTEGIEALPTRDGKIVISKHDFLLLSQFLAAQNKAADDAAKRAEYWEGRYATAEDCVREKLKVGKPVMTCFNDLEI